MRTDIWKWLMKYSLLILICILTLVVRMWNITAPVLDWHSWKQADAVSVSQRYVDEGIDIFIPRYHDLSDIPSGMDNPEGYRMAEFPLVNALVAAVVIAIPAFDVVVVSRVFSIAFSIGMVICLYWLARLISGRKVAFWVSLCYALLPYAVYYGRSTLHEPAVVFLSTLGILSWYFWLQHRQLGWYAVSGLSLALALMIKPFAIFMLPCLLGLTVAKYKKQAWKVFSLPILLVLVVLPLAWWRIWIEQYPAGIPANTWLFNDFAASTDPWVQRLFGYNAEGSRYQPFWFRWLLIERFGKLLFGFLGFVYIPFAYKKLTTTEFWLLGSWTVSMIMYLIIVAHGNLQHDYYQQLLIPLVTYVIGRGIVVFDGWLAKKLTGFTTSFVVFGILILSWGISLWFVKDYYRIHDLAYQKAGEAVQRISQPEDLVIANNAIGDTSFLFQTRRNGWPIGVGVEDKADKGAKYYVSTTFDQNTDNLEDRYFTVERTAEYIILDLSRTNDQELQ